MPPDTEEPREFRAYHEPPRPAATSRGRPTARCRGSNGQNLKTKPSDPRVKSTLPGPSITPPLVSTSSKVLKYRISKRRPKRSPKNTSSPPPVFHARLLLSPSSNRPGKSADDLRTPTPARAYGRTPKPFCPPKGTASTTLP